MPKMGDLLALLNAQYQIEWCSVPTLDQVESVSATDLTAGSITPAVPTGATVIRTLLEAHLHISNNSGNGEKLALKVQGQKDGGGYSDLLDLTAYSVIGTWDADRMGDIWCCTVDVTDLVDTPGVQYDFRFEVIPTNGYPVNCTCSFVLKLVYKV